ncbi:MAG: TonB-dependent receptor plug domain-containing protein, partial [Sphingobium sp.]
MGTSVLSFKKLWNGNSSYAALGIALVLAGTAVEGHAQVISQQPLPAADDAGDAAADSGEIIVSGRRVTDTIEAGPLGSRSIQDTPFSVAQTDSVQIERIAATTIDAAFNYDPSVRSNNSGLASGNTFSVRGQSVDLTNGYKYDGLAFPYWFQDHPIEAVDQIQVLKGAGGFVYGYASPSGVVNFVSKKPTDELIATANLSFRSSSIWRAHVDVGGPLTEGGSTKFRFNGVVEDGRLYNGAQNKNKFVQLWLQTDLTDKLSWSVDGFYQRTWQAQQSNTVSITTAVTSLNPVRGDFNLGSPSTNKLNDVAQLTGRLNYKIDNDWKVSGALRYSTLDERFTGNTATISNNRGDYTLSLLGQNRAFYYYVGQLSFEGKFDTGALSHTLVGGLDYLNVDFDYDFNPYTANGRPTATPFPGLSGNIYTTATPDWAGSVGTSGLIAGVSSRLFQRPPDWFRYQEIRQRSLFLSDTVKLGNFELMLGGRYT